MHIDAHVTLKSYAGISSAEESLAGDVTYVAGLDIAGVLGGASLRVYG